MIPLVSVVMPAYNAENFIGLAISSVLNQTYQNIELIIVDDASTDNTVNVIKEYSDPRLKLIHNKINKGEGGTRDAAIKNSSGDWIAVIDADDAWLPERLEKMLSQDITSERNFLLIDNIMQCYQSASELKSWKPIWSSKDIYLSSNILTLKDYLSAERFLIKPLIPSWAISSNKLCHSDLRFGADTEFFIKLIKINNLKLKVLPEPLYLYRLTPGSMSTNVEKYKIFRDMFSHLIKTIDFSEDEKQAIINRISTLNKEIHYFSFLTALKNKKILLATKMLLRRPSNLFDLFTRIPGSIFYRIHIFLNKGIAR